jgi:hypothetical protein
VTDFCHTQLIDNYRRNNPECKELIEKIINRYGLNIGLDMQRGMKNINRSEYVFHIVPNVNILPNNSNLYSNFSLQPNQFRNSPTEAFLLIFQEDQNLVLYAISGSGTVNNINDGSNYCISNSQNYVRPLWNSYSVNSDGVRCVMQGDGNLVIYDQNNVPKWASGTVGNPGASLTVQDDGNVVIYNTGGGPVWATNTNVPYI